MSDTARLHPMYVSLSCRHDQNSVDYNVATTADNNNFNAIAIISSTSPFLNKCSDFVMFVERMECSSNGIPFYDASNLPDPNNREVITIHSKLAVVADTTTEVDINAYTLSHLFEILNSYDYIDPNDASEFNMTFSIGKDGHVILTLLDEKTFTDFEVQFPPRLNQILGITTAVQINGATACSSSFPRIDMGDDLDHIVIQTNLPTVSDQAGNVKLNVLTDFCPPSSYSNSLSYGPDGNLVKSGFSTSLRQKLIYTPSERRFIDLIGDFPIYEIKTELFYVNNEDVLKRVVLPYGGSFEIKLGFYLRNG